MELSQATVSAFGTRICLQASSPPILTKMLDLLPPDSKFAPQGQADCVMSIIEESGRLAFYKDSHLLLRTQHEGALLESFEADLQIFVAERAPQFTFIHAGFIMWFDRGILIPGRSFSGKTMLVSEFLKAGATYYSDEYAVVDCEGFVHPYAKQLAFRAPGKIQQQKIAPDAFGASAGNGRVRVGLILLTEFKQGASWQPSFLTRGEAALALLSNTVPARYDPRKALDAVAKISNTAMALRSPRGDASEVISYTRELIWTRRFNPKPTFEGRERRQLNRGL